MSIPALAVIKDGRFIAAANGIRSKRDIPKMLEK